MWGLVTGFAGYAFCKAHSTAYGVEAYQSAWLKRNYPAEFMAAVLTNGKGFYDPLVYVLESYRLGLKFLPPTVNEPGPGFTVVKVTKVGPSCRSAQISRTRSSTSLPGERFAIRVPLTRAKGLTERTIKRLLAARDDGPFVSLADFHRRVTPSPEELETMIRAGGFDEFGATRTRQFWEAQGLVKSAIRNPQSAMKSRTLEFDFDSDAKPVSSFFDQHANLLREPTRRERLEVETELFAQTYKNYGLATVRYPVLEVVATVEPFENGRGFSLRVLRAGKPRVKGAVTSACSLMPNTT